MSNPLTTLKQPLQSWLKSERTVARAQAIDTWMSSAKAAKLAFFTIGGILVAFMLTAISAETVLAQADVGNQYEGDAIHTTLQNIRNYIIGILLLLGGIGFAIGLGVKAIAGTNENMHHASHLAMKGGALAVIGSAIVIPVMEIMQGIASAGSSGGGGG